MLNWAKQFNIFCFLDNQQYSVQPQEYECLLAAGVDRFVQSGNANELDVFLSEKNDWVFGHLAYQLKDQLHFPGQKKDRIGFPPCYFFVPRFLLLIQGNELSITAAEPERLYQTIMAQPVLDEAATGAVAMQPTLTRAQYIEKIKKLQAHILRGDCYEINFCQEFFCEHALVDCHAVFQKLMAVSPNPFSALYRLGDKYVLCASPERFLSRRQNKLVSQPIKGTIGRNTWSQAEDDKRSKELQSSEKDRSENVMVVDLVRNDLAKICEDGSVHVDELFGIYSYPQVHQMISTISGKLKSGTRFSEILQASFPMGSMTGAPKHRVIELIDELEEQGRGIFSGSVGYIKPGGDFDFNVVIRSIMYNATEKYLSYQVGSGITFYSQPEKEWEECLLKAEAMKSVLEGGQ